MGWGGRHDLDFKTVAMNEEDQLCNICNVNINCLFTYLFYVWIYITFDMLDTCGLFSLNPSGFQGLQLVEKLNSWEHIVVIFRRNGNS